MLRSLIAGAVLLASTFAADAGHVRKHRHHQAVVAPACFLFFCSTPSQGSVSGAVDAGMRSLVDTAAFAAGVPASIAHGVIRTESNYNPQLRGRAGEYGIGQIKCQTARSVGFAGDCSQLFDASTNLIYSMRYLRLALDRGGSGCAGASLYQRGVYGRLGCSGYGRVVMARAGR